VVNIPPSFGSIGVAEFAAHLVNLLAQTADLDQLADRRSSPAL
jgi:hypothetical protein